MLALKQLKKKFFTLIILLIILPFVAFVFRYSDVNLGTVFKTNYNPQLLCIQFNDEVRNRFYINPINIHKNSPSAIQDDIYYEMPLRKDARFVIETKNKFFNCKKTIVADIKSYIVITKFYFLDIPYFQFTEQFLYGLIIS